MLNNKKSSQNSTLFNFASVFPGYNSYVFFRLLSGKSLDWGQDNVKIFDLIDQNIQISYEKISEYFDELDAAAQQSIVDSAKGIVRGLKVNRILGGQHYNTLILISLL